MSETTLQATRTSPSTALATVLGATAAAVAIRIVATLAGAPLTVGFGAGQPIQIHRALPVLGFRVGNLLSATEAR